MGLSRRQVIAAGLAGASRAAAQNRTGNGPRVRLTPPVCLYSQALIKIPYDELGAILRDLDADGCDLSVQAGGHVVPEQAPVDLSRSIEAVTGVGLDVPVISTAYTSLDNATIRNVAAIAGDMGVPLFRTGVWKYGASDPETRLAEVQRDLAGLAALARAAKMVAAVPNVAGEYVGAAIWDIHNIMRGLDPRYAGYAFDPGYAVEEGGVGAWSVALRLVLPRIKMLVARDFTWNKDGVWKPVPCPLGEGMVDWPKIFAALARIKFVGPISVQVDYQPRNELTAIRRDLAFVKKQIAAAYGG
jgi:L-ribulose-5-phosphate 3-epimerase